MPHVWAHLLFGDQLLQKTGHSGLTAAYPDKNLFHLGCQGPDLLFYYRFLPWQDSKGMSELGGLMHSKDCGPALLHMLDASARHPNDSALRAYVVGFLCHHILDRNMHPFIFSKSGFKKWNHQRFEVMLDTVVAKKLRNVETWRTPVVREIDAGPALPASIRQILASVVREHYPDWAAAAKEDVWNSAYRDMLSAHRLFHDPFGWKRVMTAGQMSQMVYNRTVPPVDLMNETRASWMDPTDGRMSHTESAWELWDRALEDGERSLAAVFEWFRLADAILDASRFGEAAAALDVFREALGNRSYETGTPCEEGKTIRFADPII